MFVSSNEKRNTMKSFSFSLALIVLQAVVAVSLPAQEPAGTKIYGGSGYFMTGYSRMDPAALNARFSEQGLPALPEGGWFLGGGGHYIFRNLILGGEGGGVISSPATGPRYNVTSSGGYGFLNVGYVVLSRGSILAYPLVGAGGGGMSVLITDRTGLPDSFDALLRDPVHQSLLMHGGFMMNFSVGIDWFVGGGQEGSGTGGWLVGLKAGYLLDTADDNWMLDDRKLTGAPAAGMSGFYVRITLGGGGFVRK